ncbi:MAG TPA: M90 family metallopeptidase [Polyangiaceae bacterium]|nr:M90 family metallopeptidase [Polyangiaceae bacterium]
MLFDWWRRLSRAEVIADVFPERFRALILRRVPCAKLLREPELAKLEALVRIFNSEKTFEAAGGLELDEEMRVIIAARACLLVLERVELDSPLYPGLDTIIVYPSSYRAPVREREGYVVVEGEQARLGESWTRGVVVLSWDAVQAGDASPSDGHDVVLHEFAHQLDAEDGEMDGTPELGALERYAVWSKVAGAEYQALLEDVERHRKTSIDPYGATNAPEFFAVVVEQFFEKPAKLAQLHPELYRELATFFRFDPALRSRSEVR